MLRSSGDDENLCVQAAVCEFCTSYNVQVSALEVFHLEFTEYTLFVCMSTSAECAGADMFAVESLRKRSGDHLRR